MSESLGCPSSEAETAAQYITRMEAAKERPSVLKIKLINLRARMPDGLVFAFEGDDDKIVYGQWIRRLRPELHYEPFPCGGKKGVKSLKVVLERDRGNLQNDVYFFIDRDFDDLAGFPNNENVYLTQSYSVENVLVCPEVLVNLLRDEFPCHALPEARSDICMTFEEDYSNFLKVTSDVNKRLFVARRLPIELTQDIPTGLNKLAIVEIGHVTSSDYSPVDVIALEREPFDDEVGRFEDEFRALPPALRYRGKFALKFFSEWLRQLSAMHASGASDFFKGCDVGSRVRNEELVLSNFAGKSPLPCGLAEFMAAL